MAKNLHERIEQALKATKDFDSFVHGLLGDTLRWPIEQNVTELRGIGWDWSEQELEAEGLSEKVVDGRVWQIQPRAPHRQPWGIFLLDFAHEDVFTAGRGMVGPVRQVLRGLVPRRRRDPDLPFWQHENLLFICTHQWQHFAFAHFKGEKAVTANLSTFGWTRGQPGLRTLCEFNLRNLTWPETPSDHGAWRQQWASAFDKNALVERFFREFTEVCKVLAADIATQNLWDEPKANTEAQVLLERLLFLYFVQRKGWLNQSRSYLVDEFNRNHKDRPDDTSYTQGFLNVVFRRLGSRQMRRHEEIGYLPFLNGGLFQDDPEAQQRRPALRVTNRVMGHIFENLLERYNFTIREDTPLDQDVAIDPEMLGKVLECLILTMEKAEGAPDKRKATGSYYTPRIVVHFICREVLRQFLLARLNVATSGSPVVSHGNRADSATEPVAATQQDWAARLNRLFAIDASAGITASQLQELRRTISQAEAAHIRKLLYGIKACDPAVGSGAFAVGLLHELVNLTILCDTIECGKDPRVANLNRIYELKEHFIENALYGVDILERAAEIARLRLWLSLIVDYQLPVDPFACTAERFAEAIENVPPLPNLEFKIRRGDSLLDQIHGHPIRMEIFTHNPAARRLLDQLAALKHDFFGAAEPLRKRSLHRRILHVKLDLAELFITDRLKPSTTIQDDLIAADDPDLREQRLGEAEKRRRRQAEKVQLEEALRDVRDTRDALDRLKPGPLSEDEEDTLRCLDGQVGPHISFVWGIDFMEVFSRAQPRTGFDIIVGNPPFVLCSSATQRASLARNYPRVFGKNTQLAAYFMVRTFDLLSRGGVMGYIVADGFAVARFGEYIVNDFLPTKNLTRVMSTGGFNLEGHGTATVLVFAGNEPPGQAGVWLASCKKADKTRGNIEGRPIWQEMLGASGPANYEGEYFSAREVSRLLMAKHPWPLNVAGDVEGIAATDARLSQVLHQPLRKLSRRRIGSMLVTRCDDAFIQPREVFRRASLPAEALRPCLQGEFIRDWSVGRCLYVIFPYDAHLRPVRRTSVVGSEITGYLRPFRRRLETRKAFGKTQKEAGLKWWEYNMLMRPQFEALRSAHLLAYACITTTQNHWVEVGQDFAAQHSVQVMTAKEQARKFTLLAFLNSSTACFLMKRRGKPKRQEADPIDQYYDYDGTAVGRLPVPAVIAEALSYLGGKGGGAPGQGEGT